MTVVKGFLAISAAARVGGGWINTLNVTCGQWNKGMIYVGMATPRIRWDMCLVAGLAEGRRGGGTATQRKNCKRLKKVCFAVVDRGTTPLPSLLSLSSLFISLTHHAL